MAFYRKKQLQQLEPFKEDMPIDLVSISESDKKNGSPKTGDMIAFNQNDATDIWLVSEKFFKENYEFVKR